MSFDLTTGFELEVLLPEGMSRLELLDRLALRWSAEVVRFEFTSKVPVPDLSGGVYAPDRAADLTVALIRDIARHHQASVRSVTPDFRYFYLIHRAGKIVDRHGSTILSVVHDNTLAGGERVAEIVTAPLARPDLPWLIDLVSFIGGIEGCTVPEGAALHVHVDGRPFRNAAVLARLVAFYTEHEEALMRFAGTTRAMRRAKSLPIAFVDALLERAREDATWDVAQRLILDHIPSREFGLNLFNLVQNDPAKLTVEFKIARGTLEPDRVLELRALYLAIAEYAITGRGEIAGAFANRAS